MIIYDKISGAGFGTLRTIKFGIEYTGPMQNGKPHGQGFIRYKNNHSLEVGFVSGEPVEFVYSSLLDFENILGAPISTNGFDSRLIFGGEIADEGTSGSLYFGHENIVKGTLNQGNVWNLLTTTGFGVKFKGFLVNGQPWNGTAYFPDGHEVHYSNGKRIKSEPKNGQSKESIFQEFIMRAFRDPAKSGKTNHFNGAWDGQGSDKTPKITGNFGTDDPDEEKKKDDEIIDRMTDLMMEQFGFDIADSIADSMANDIFKNGKTGRGNSNLNTELVKLLLGGNLNEILKSQGTKGGK